MRVKKNSNKAVTAVITCLFAVITAALALILTGLFGGSVAASAEDKTFMCSSVSGTEGVDLTVLGHKTQFAAWRETVTDNVVEFEHNIRFKVYNTTTTRYNTGKKYAFYFFISNSKNSYSNSFGLFPVVSGSSATSKMGIAMARNPESVLGEFEYIKPEGDAFYDIVFTLTQDKFELKYNNAVLYSCASADNMYTTYYSMLEQGYAFYLNPLSSLDVGSGVSPLYLNYATVAVEEQSTFVTRTPVELPEDPEKEGHTFAGWYYGSQAQHGEDCTAYNGEPIYEDTALHAHFNINRYTVTYNTLGGTPVDKITVDWNTSLNCPAPTKTGYDFAGWYLPDGTLYVNQPIKTNTTLTAKWQVKIFTVTFYIEGENGNETYKTIDVPYGSTLGKAMEDAKIISYKVMSQEGVRVSKESIITEDTAALVEKLSGWEKYGDFVARNSWYTWLIAGIGVALIITATVAIIVAVKRR